MNYTGVLWVFVLELGVSVCMCVCVCVLQIWNTHAQTHTHTKNTHRHTHTNTHLQTCTNSLQKSNPLSFRAQVFCQQVIFWFSERNKQHWCTRTECGFSLINLIVVVVYIWSPLSSPLLKYIRYQSFTFHQLLVINISNQLSVFDMSSWPYTKCHGKI